MAAAFTAEGFAISGAALYEPELDRFTSECEECFRRNPQLSNFRRCEVYRRVVGHLRPVSQGNERKPAEIRQRKSYRVRGTMDQRRGFFCEDKAL